ncbi:hypothetical protein V3C99_008272 [Haemonchus contortus]
MALKYGSCRGKLGGVGPSNVFLRALMNDHRYLKKQQLENLRVGEELFQHIRVNSIYSLLLSGGVPDERRHEPSFVLQMRGNEMFGDAFGLYDKATSLSSMRAKGKLAGVKDRGGSSIDTEKEY